MLKKDKKRDSTVVDLDKEEQQRTPLNPERNELYQQDTTPLSSEEVKLIWVKFLSVDRRGQGKNKETASFGCTLFGQSIPCLRLLFEEMRQEKQ